MPRGRPAKKKPESTRIGKILAEKEKELKKEIGTIIELEKVHYLQIPLEQLKPNPWNPQTMTDADEARLENSIQKWGQVENLVVRKLEDKDTYQIIGGEHRWKLLIRQNEKFAVCAVVEGLNDEDAMLMSEVLNTLKGQPDSKKYQQFFKALVPKIPIPTLVSYIPKTEETIKNIIVGIMEQVNNVTGNKNTGGSPSDDGLTIKLKFEFTTDQGAVIAQALQKAAIESNISDFKSSRVKGNLLEKIAADYLAGA